MNQILESGALPAKAPRRHFQHADRRCYTAAQVRALFADMPRATFYRLKKQGKLPLIEVRPRLGHLARYQAGPIDRWLANRGR